MTNTRAHICNNGYPGAVISRDAWLRVAKHERENKSNLSIAMVEDKIDIQRSYVAQEFFKEEVEKAMKDNGDYKEAYFCEIGIMPWIREAYQPFNAPNTY